MASSCMKPFLLHFSRRRRKRDNNRITSSSSSLRPHFETVGSILPSCGRSVLCRLLAKIRRWKERKVHGNECGSGRKRRWGKKVKMLGFCRVNDHDRQSSLLIVKRSSSSSSAERSERERYVREVPLNFGAGISLAFLLAAYKNELNKMAELRKQMEALMKDFNNIISKRKEVRSTTIDSNNNVILSATNASGVVFSHQLVEIENVSEQERCLKSDRSTGEPCQVRFDHLEAEFEAEFELLQQTLDAEDSLECQRQEIGIAVENVVPIKSLCRTVDRLDDSQEADSGDYFKVSLREVERRLHECITELGLH